MLTALKVQQMCQADVGQYASKRDFKPIPCGAQQLGYSAAKENSLKLCMVCLIDEDIGQSQWDPINLWLPGWEQTIKVNYYQVIHQQQL